MGPSPLLCVVKSGVSKSGTRLTPALPNTTESVTFERLEQEFHDNRRNGPRPRYRCQGC